MARELRVCGGGKRLYAEQKSLKIDKTKARSSEGNLQRRLPEGLGFGLNRSNRFRMEITNGIES